MKLKLLNDLKLNNIFCQFNNPLMNHPSLECHSPPPRLQRNTMWSKLFNYEFTFDFFIIQLFSQIRCSTFLNIQQSLAVTLPPVKLFSQQHYSELGPKKLEFSYFSPSYAIFSPQLCYFLLFPPSYTILLPPVMLFLIARSQNSICAGEVRHQNSGKSDIKIRGSPISKFCLNSSKEFLQAKYSKIQ